VRRNFAAAQDARRRAVTLVYTGVSHHGYWTEQELAAFDALMVSGSRAVFTFYPVEHTESAIQQKRQDEAERVKKKEKSEEEKSGGKKKKGSDRKKKKKDEKKSDGKDSKDSKDDEDEDPEKYFVKFDAVAKRWGFAFGYLPEEKKAFDRHAALVEPGGKLESDLTWHSSLYFRDLKPQWKVLYMCGTMPVVSSAATAPGVSFLPDAYSSATKLRAMASARLFAAFRSPMPVFDEESHGL
jgi:hypothetical protein